jgi:hypothetical protein
MITAVTGYRAGQGADDRAHETLDRGGDRRTQAGLHHDHGREHRPIALRQAQEGRQGERRADGGRDPDGVADLGLPRRRGLQRPLRKIGASEAPPVAGGGLGH